MKKNMTQKKSQSKRTSVPYELETPTHLGDSARIAISQALNPLVADAFALYVKTKNFHWHLAGPHFRDFHLLFDEQAEQIFNMIDVIAERVRKLGGLTIHSIGEIGRLQTIKDDDDILVGSIEMVRRLHRDNQKFSTSLFKAHQVCEKHNDFASTSIIEIFMDETERRAWFLFELQVE